LGALWLDLKDPLLGSAVSSMSPGFLRIGGSLDNVVKYLVGPMTQAQCNAPVYDKEQLWYNLCMNMSRWDDLQQFVRQSGLELIFGLSYLSTGLDKRWSSSNVLDLLNYTATRSKKPSVLYAVELGEEMAPSPDSAAFNNLIGAYSQLRKTITKLWPDLSARPKILGPCVGMSNEEPGPGFAFTRAFLNRTLSDGLLDAVVMHSYNNDGGDNWERPGFLSQTASQAVTMLSETRLHSATAGLWCGECGPHNHGGLENVTDRFVSSFWYADALGGLARAGLVQFGRQALIGGNYGLLRTIPKTSTKGASAKGSSRFLPNPDYYTAVLWKRLMGQEVLKVDVEAMGAAVGEAEGEVWGGGGRETACVRPLLSC
jgi:heparanase 1